MTLDLPKSVYNFLLVTWGAVVLGVVVSYSGYVLPNTPKIGPAELSPVTMRALRNENMELRRKIGSLEVRLQKYNSLVDATP